MPMLTDEDAELDRRWRLAFGGPLPMLGAPEIALELLERQLATLAHSAAGETSKAA